MTDMEFTVNHRYQYYEDVGADDYGLFKAKDLNFRRDVAIKKVKIQGDSVNQINKNYKSAIQEVKTMVLIAENTVQIPNVYEYYWDKKINALYIIMQWINGKTLEDLMLEKSITPYQFLSWMCDLCEILNEMSKKQFYHKDIKPQNIIIDKNEILYLIDFGITVSDPGVINGTQNYKAPEMDIGSCTVERREPVDIFSIGVMLYQFFTGKIPKRKLDYDNKNPQSSQWTFYREPKSLNSDISPTLNKIIKKSMAYNPKDRYRKYKDLIYELKEAKREIKL